MRPVPGSCSSAYGLVFDANFSARGRVVPSVTAASIHHDDSSEIDLIFGPVVAAQTYRNLLFALVSFPLAILYFVTMMAGLAIGAGTAVIFAGFVILAMVLSIGRLFGRLERELAKAMLGATFDPISAAAWAASRIDRWQIVENGDVPDAQVPAECNHVHRIGADRRAGRDDVRTGPLHDLPVQRERNREFTGGAAGVTDRMPTVSRHRACDQRTGVSFPRLAVAKLIAPLFPKR